MFFKILKRIRLEKITAVLTAMSFMLSVFTSGGYAAPSQMPMPAQPTKIAVSGPSDYIVPFNIGRVTDALNAGSGKVIVNIQDLHAHEETQRNINNILTMLDAKYGINKIYVEGAVGQLSTGWLANIEDEKFKDAAVDALMKDGKLSGAEYYSIKSSKTNILHGIENRELYLENFVRLNEMYKKRDEIQNIIPEINILLKNISDQYYSKENLVFINNVNKYKAGKISADKHFNYMIEKAASSEVNFANYPSIINFAKIIRLQSSLNSKKISSQMTELVGALKEEMPYSEYKRIADLFGKQEEEGNLYLALANVYEKYGFAGKYKELGKFFEMVKLNQTINPVDLVLEERQLTKEIMYRFAKTNIEVEVIFLNDMFSTFENYLNNKVSAKEYDFFEKSLPEFKVLWEKYVDIAGLPELNKYYDMFDQFYKVNIERNRYFLQQITGFLPKQTKEKIRLIKDTEQKSAAKLLENSKNLDVVITGGFHTHDLAKLMGDNGYSYIVITPNVTQDTVLSDRNYEANILGQAAVLNNTFKDMLQSSMINFSESNPIPYIASYVTSFQILQTAENEGVLQNFPEIFSQMVADNAQELKDKFNINDLAVAVPVKDGDTYKVAFTYKNAQGQTQRVEETITEDTQRLEFDSKKQTWFSVAGTIAAVGISAAIGFFFAPVSVPVAIAAAAAVGLTGTAFNLAGLANASIISRSMSDFGSFIFANLENSYAAPETQIPEIAGMQLPNGMTQEEYLKRFEDKLKAKSALDTSVTLKSIFDLSPSISLSTIATVRKSEPNVIYVNPIALFFLEKRSFGLAETLISKHEQLHTLAGGQKGEIRTSIENTYNFKFLRHVFSAFKKSRTDTATRAKIRSLISKMKSFESMFRNNTDVKADYSMEITGYLSNAKELFKLLDSNPYLNTAEMKSVEDTLYGIAEFVFEIADEVLIENPYNKDSEHEKIRHGIFNQLSLQAGALRNSVKADLKSRYPNIYNIFSDSVNSISEAELLLNLLSIREIEKVINNPDTSQEVREFLQAKLREAEAGEDVEIAAQPEMMDARAVREILFQALDMPEVDALYAAISEFDKSSKTIEDVKKLQEAMAKIEINLSDSRAVNIAKVDALAEALKKVRYTADGQEYSYTEENALVFKLQTLIGFGIVNPTGIDDPIVLADTFMPIAQSAEYVAEAAKKVISLDYLKEQTEGRSPASMVYLWLNGGLGENVLARHPIIYALRTFSSAMESARAANDTAAIQRLSDIAKGNDLFGRGLAAGEEIYGFTRITPSDFYEKENGKVKVDAKGKPAVKKTVTINGTEVEVPALTGKATDTPFVVKGDDGIYEFRSIMDIKVNELKGHANATGVQIVGPGGEAVAMPLTEIEGVRNESILAKVLGQDAARGLIIQERYNPWVKEENADGSTIYKMDFSAMNPGGHGTIAFDLVVRLSDAYKRYMAENNLKLSDMTPEQIEKAKQELGDVVFANGDGVNSGPKGRLGAVTLYGVPRQTVDAKGGIFGFIKDRMGRLFLYLSELGNTPEALKKLFQKYGLEEPYNTPQGFNTNTQQIGVFETGALFAELMDIYGTERVFNLMASPTITAADNRKFEWAIGQIMLWANANLQLLRNNGTLQGDRVNELMNKILGENNEFVTLVISDDSQREEIGFTPYKFVTDIIKYMYGGSVVNGAWVPYNSHGLDVNVKGDAASYLYYMYDNWTYLSTENLTDLNLDGDFILSGLNLSGNMTFENKSGKEVELTAETPALSGLNRDAEGKPILENMTVTVDENGEISIVTKDGVTVWDSAVEVLADAVGSSVEPRTFTESLADAVTPELELLPTEEEVAISKFNDAFEKFQTKNTKKNAKEVIVAAHDVLKYASIEGDTELENNILKTADLLENMDAEQTLPFLGTYTLDDYGYGEYDPYGAQQDYAYNNKKMHSRYTAVKSFARSIKNKRLQEAIKWDRTPEGIKAYAELNRVAGIVGDSGIHEGYWDRNYDWVNKHHYIDLSFFSKKEIEMLKDFAQRENEKSKENHIGFSDASSATMGAIFYYGDRYSNILSFYVNSPEDAMEKARYFENLLTRFKRENAIASVAEKAIRNLKTKVEAYTTNKTEANFAAAEKALEAIEFDITNESIEVLEARVAQVGTIIEQLYGVSHAEEIQQVAMVQEYIRGIKEGAVVDVEGFLADENLDSETIMSSYPGLVTKMSDIDEKYGTQEFLKNTSVVFNLGLAGIGESLDRVEFLKAWYVLKVRQGEAKTDAEREAISRAVETREFLNEGWYAAEYAELVNNKAMQEKYGLDITTEDIPRFKTKAGDPQLKTKALDIGLRVKGIDGYWTIKSVAEIILDDFIAKKNDGYEGLALNLFTNAESMEDVKSLLQRKAYTGKSYEEELISLGVLKKMYGEDYAGYDGTAGLYLQNTHPTIKYDKATGKMNFFGFQQLINHGSFFANPFRQMAESKEKENAYWFFGNTDNFEAGQIPSKLFGWMSDNKKKAALIVTEKGTSEGNKKGGIPTIVGTATSALGTAIPIFKIVEIAQVKGNKELETKFQEANHAFFNTNMLTANKAEVLSAIENLEQVLEDEKVVEAISNAYPLKNLNSKEKIMDYLYVLGDLIVNNKETSAGDEYVKLEIAIASSLMEFSNLVALATGETFLEFILLNEREAKDLFGPIKNLTNFTETFDNVKMIMNADGTQEIIFEDEAAGIVQAGAAEAAQLFGNIFSPIVDYAKRTAEAFASRMKDLFSEKDKDAELITRLNKQLEIMRSRSFANMSVKEIVDLFLQEGALTQEEAEKMLTETLDKIKFGTAGYRKQFGPEFNYVHVLIIAQALANSALEEYKKPEYADKGKPRIFIGYDTRYMSKEFSEVFSGILAANDVDVDFSDRDVPTPVVSYIMKNEPVYVFSVNMTASHNPYDYNGIKVTNSVGGQATTDVTAAIEQEIRKVVSGSVNINYKTLAQGVKDESVNILSSKDVKDKYIAGFVEMFKRQFNINTDAEFETFKQKAADAFFVVDAKNGTTPDYYETLFEILGIKNYEIFNADFDPTFHGEDPNPDRNVDELKGKVQDLVEKNPGKLVFGLSTDPDGDRMAVIEAGHHFSTDDIILYNAYKLVQQGIALSDSTGKKQTVTLVVNRPTSVSLEALKKHAEDNNWNVDIEIVRVPVGFKWIAVEMQNAEEKAKNNGLIPLIMGAEESGAVVVGGLTYDKDGLVATLYTSLLTLNDAQSIASTMKEITDLLGWVPTKILRNIELDQLSQLDVVKKYLQSVLDANGNTSASALSMQKFEELFGGVLEQYGLKFTGIEDINYINGKKVDGKGAFEGIRITTNDPHVWIALRLSGTEPIVKAYIETGSSEMTEALGDISETVIKNIAAGSGLAQDATVIQKSGAVLSDSVNRYINAFRKTLSQMFIGTSFVDKRAPQLRNKSYTYVAAEYNPSIVERARVMAAKGVNVNIVMAYPYEEGLSGDINSVNRQELSVYADANDASSKATIWKYSEALESGKNINIYFYKQDDKRIVQKQTPEERARFNMAYSQKTLELLKDEALQRGEYDFGIIDIQRSTGISFEMAQNMFPDAVIATSIGSDVSPIFESVTQRDSGFAVYLEGAEEQFLVAAGEMIKNSDKDSYMKTSPIFSTTVDVSKMSLSDFNSDAAIKELKSYGFDTMVIKLDSTNTIDDLETLRNVLIKAHQQDVKVVIEYAFADYSSFENWLSSLSSQLASFRASTGVVAGAKEFVDGIRLDLLKMSEADAKKAAEKFKTVRNIINRENSDAVFGVKSSYYDEGIYKSEKIRKVEIISHDGVDESSIPGLTDSLTSAEDVWVEFSIGETSYDSQSMDYDLTSKSVEDKMTKAADAAMVGVDYEVVNDLKKAEEKMFSTLDMLTRVFMQKTAAYRNSPDGVFDTARKQAVKQNISVSKNSEAALYKRLSDLREGENVKEAVDEIASILSASSLMSDLAGRLKTADDKKAALIVENAKGYLQGVLENTEISNYEKAGGKTNFVVKENKATLGQMLVEAKLMLMTQGIDVSMDSKDVPYSKELKSMSNKEALDMIEVIEEKTADLQRVLDLIESQDTVTAAEAFERIQEAINILNSLIESDALSSDAKPIVLSELLTMLAMKADFMPSDLIDTAKGNVNNLAASTRAFLAAA